MNDDTRSPANAEDILAVLLGSFDGKAECRIMATRRLVVSGGRADCRRGIKSAYCKPARYIHARCPRN